MQSIIHRQQRDALLLIFRRHPEITGVDAPALKADYDRKIPDMLGVIHIEPTPLLHVIG